MNHPALKVLIATADGHWRAQCLGALADSESSRLHIASRGQEALELLRKNAYNFVVFDDSLPDMGLVEFGLTVRDVAPNNPPSFVAGDDSARFQRVWDHCNVLFAGPKETLLTKMRDTALHCPNETE